MNRLGATSYPATNSQILPLVVPVVVQVDFADVQTL